jgi:hypothetical protein
LKPLPTSSCIVPALGPNSSSALGGEQVTDRQIDDLHDWLASSAMPLSRGPSHGCLPRPLFEALTRSRKTLVADMGPAEIVQEIETTVPTRANKAARTPFRILSNGFPDTYAEILARHFPQNVTAVELEIATAKMISCVQFA